VQLLKIGYATIYEDASPSRREGREVRAGRVGRSSGRVGLFCAENCTISQSALPLSGPESPTLPEGEYGSV
jgi:hypothetical protein